MKETSNTPSIESTKRSFLRSAASVGLGSMALGQSGLAQDSSDFRTLVRSSKQYQTLSKPVFEAGFRPQFDKALVFQLGRNETATGANGTGMVIPTRNTNDNSATVELKAFRPANTNELELSAVVKLHGAPAGRLYTNSELVETDPGYTSTHGTAGQGPIPFGDWIPGNPIDTIIDKGRNIVDGAEDVWTETAEFVANNDKIETAVALGKDALKLGVNVISPVEGNKPPRGLRRWAGKKGYEYVATVDLSESCAYVSVAAWIGASGITIVSLGAGAVSFAFATKLSSACAIYSLANHYMEDAGMCVPSNLYVFRPTGAPEIQGVPPTPLIIPYC